jgi:hypothetical protein
MEPSQAKVATASMAARRRQLLSHIPAKAKLPAQSSKEEEDTKRGERPSLRQEVAQLALKHRVPADDCQLFLGRDMAPQVSTTARSDLQLRCLDAKSATPAQVAQVLVRRRLMHAAVFHAAGALTETVHDEAWRTSPSAWTIEERFEWSSV